MDAIATSWAFSPIYGDFSNLTYGETVVKVELKSVIFTSDHGLLTDYNSNYTGSGGTVYNPRGWTETGTNNPISHTKGTNISANVKLCIQPTGLGYNLTGDGFVQYLSFHTNGVTSSGSDQALALVADTNLPVKVDVINHSINWSVNFGGTMCVTTSSGPHKVYVTWGNPGTGPTLKRMDWACGNAQGATSITTAAEDFKDIISVNPGYDRDNLGNNTWNTNSWQFLDSNQRGDCITLAALACTGLRMIGIPATLCWSFPTADSSAG